MDIEYLWLMKLSYCPDKLSEMVVWDFVLLSQGVSIDGTLHVTYPFNALLGCKVSFVLILVQLRLENGDMEMVFCEKVIKVKMFITAKFYMGPCHPFWKMSPDQQKCVQNLQ